MEPRRPQIEPQRSQRPQSIKGQPNERFFQPFASFVVFVLFVVPISVFSVATLHAQVSFDRILRADQESQNWLTYSGTFMSQRYSQLAQITPANVKNLELQWVFQARSLEKFETTPLVVDGVMYTVQSPNDVIALSADTGKTIWTYSHKPDPAARKRFSAKLSLASGKNLAPGILSPWIRRCSPFSPMMPQ